MRVHHQIQELNLTDGAPYRSDCCRRSTLSPAGPVQAVAVMAERLLKLHDFYYTSGLRHLHHPGRGMVVANSQW